MNEARKKPFRLTAPKAFVPKEFQEQEAVILWAHGRPAMRLKGGKWSSPIPPTCTDGRIWLLFATLNGIRLTPGLIRKATLAGNTAGVPDLVLPVACGGYFGWFGEGKRIKGGVVSGAQTLYHQGLRAQGYKVDIWHGAEQCKELITAYLSLPSTSRP